MKKLLFILILLFQFISQETFGQITDYQWLPDSIVARLNQKFPKIRQSGSTVEFGNHYKALINLEDDHRVARIIRFDSSGNFCEEQIILKKKQMPEALQVLLNKSFKNPKIELISLVKMVSGENYLLVALDSLHQPIVLKCFGFDNNFQVKRLTGNYLNQIVAKYQKGQPNLKLEKNPTYLNSDSEFDFFAYADSLHRKIKFCFGKDGEWLKTKIMVSYAELPEPVKKTLEKDYREKNICVINYFIHKNNSREYQVLLKDNKENILLEIMPNGVVTRNYSFKNQFFFYRRQSGYVSPYKK